MKYFISAGVFAMIYTAAEYLLTGHINGKIIAAATAAYAALYAAVDLLCSKRVMKN